MFWRNPSSLAIRLSAWYAGSAFLLLAVATGFLYWVLAKSFDREDLQYLTEKVNTLRALLEQRDFRTLQWEVQGEASARPGVSVLSRVWTAAGQVVVASNGAERELAGAAWGTAEYRSTSGRVFRMLSQEAGAWRMQVALEVTTEELLLARYRKQLWTVLAIGLILCVLVGHGIARRGIRPVEEIARAVRHIGSSTLHERVETRGLPAELSSLAAAFNRMLDRLEEAFARLARFSSDIAHELRTPVNNLRGEVEVALAKARSPEEYRDLLGSSLEECLRLSRLIDSLLFLARAEHPEMQIRREPVAIQRELAAVREFYEAAASESGVALELNANEDLKAELDRTLLQRAIGNLIENSLAYTGRGGRIALAAERHDGFLWISVADTGSGIAAEHLPRVFDRFYRVDPARSKNSGGAGLGLAIVASVAALHGGKAEIESRVGQGTRVRLVLPA